MGHLSDSSVPRRVESLIRAAPAAELNAELNPRWLSLLGGTYGDVNAVSFDDMVLVEAFAREASRPVDSAARSLATR